MKSRILVIDDNVNLTTLLAKTLGRFNYDIAVESDSVFAIDTVRRVRPQLILLDVMMPRRDGGEVLKELRNDPDLRQIPVILLTALAKEAQGLATQGGITSTIISKPVELKHLLMEIEKHLDHSNCFTTDIEESSRMGFGTVEQPPGPIINPSSKIPDMEPKEMIRGGGAFGAPIQPQPEKVQESFDNPFSGENQGAKPKQTVPTVFRSLMQAVRKVGK